MCIELAASFPGVFAAVAMHPNYLAEAGPDDWAAIRELSQAPGVVAIGETGLDRHWDFTPFDVQHDYFARHMRLADERGLPFIVHMRDCEADVLASLRAAHAERGPLSGVMHSFTGDAAMAAECIALGMHISFAGMVTYKKSRRSAHMCGDDPRRAAADRDRRAVSLARAGSQRPPQRARPPASHRRVRRAKCAA